MKDNELKVNFTRTPSTPALCKDGRWVSSVMVKNDNGKALRKSVFAESKNECEQKMKEFLETN